MSALDSCCATLNENDRSVKGLYEELGRLVLLGVRWRPVAGSTLARLRGEHSVPIDEILTLKEVAQLLKVAEKTIYTMSQKKELPAFKVRGQWRFRRDDINHWINEQQTKKVAGDSDD